MHGESGGYFLDFGQAYRKAADYCAYQDRCISEMQLKLRIWNIDSSFTKKIIDKLVEEDFLDEKRFALNYAGGKFKIKGWGKMKIAASLRARSIPAPLVKQALATINDEDYVQTLRSLLVKKLEQSGGDTRENRQKAANLALSRGFEPGLIAMQLRDVDLFEE
jgi:regulatory protein